MRHLRSHLLPLLLWTALVGVLYGPLVIGAQALPASDLTGQFYPFAVFQHRELAAGRLPVWSPGSFGGFPFAADVQAATFYPPRLLLLRLSPATPLPVHLLEIEGLLHLWLAGAGLYALTVHITARREAGLIAATTFGLGGYLTGYPLLQLAILETIAWLPLALLLIRQAARVERPLPWLAGSGLALACSALAGHPQTLLHGAYVAAAYYLYVTCRARWRPGWVLGGGALVALMAVGGSAASWYPALRYLPYTVRGDVGYGFVQSGLPLTDYLQALAPGALTRFVPQYVGMPALMLALAAWWRGSTADRALRGELRFWTVVVLLASVLALGDDGVLFELGYRILPGLGLFRQQERWLSLYSLGLAALAAIGCAHWLDADADAWRPVWRRVVVTMGLLLAISAVMLAVMLPDAPERWVRLWLCGALLTAVSATLLAPTLPRRWSWGVLLLLLFVDLGIVNLRAVPRVPAYGIEAWHQLPWAQETDAPQRIDSGGIAITNLGELYGLEDVRGISPLRPAALEALRSLPGERWRPLLDVAYVLSLTPLDDSDLEQVAVLPAGALWEQHEPARVYRSKGQLGRAWMVYQAEAVADQSVALERLREPSFDPASTVLLEGAPALPLAGSDAAPRVQVQRLAANQLQIDVETQAPGYLVISEWRLPGWRATVDGAPAKLLRADYALQSLALSAGRHQVRLWYAAHDVRQALLAAMLALLLGAALPLIVRRPVARWEPRWPARWRTWFEGLPAPSLPLPPGSALWLALSLVAVAAGLRLFRLGHQELRGDEAVSYIVALRPVRAIIPLLLRLGEPHSPLHYLLLPPTIRALGASEFGMRLPTAMLGTLTVPIVWGIGRLTGDARRAALLAAFFAIGQALVWIGQDLRTQYTLAVLFTAAATLLLLRLARRPHWLGWVAYGACCALSVYGFYYAAFAYVGHVAYVLCHRERRRLLPRFALGVGLALALFAPWLVVAYPSLIASGQLSEPSAPRLARFLVNSITYLTAGDAWPRAWVRWLAIATLPLFALGLRALWRRDRALWALALSTVVATALVNFLMQYLRATYEPRYLLGAALSWWLILVAGVESLLDRQGPVARWLGALALAALLTLNLISVYRYQTNPDYSRTSGYREAAAYVAHEAQPGDVFVTNTPDPCWDYYLRNLAMPRVMVPGHAAAGADEIAASLQELGEQYDRLWFVPQAGSSWDREQAAQHWLEYNALREQRTRFRRIDVVAYRPQRAAVTALTPLSARLENGIELLGYHLTSDGRPAARDGGAVAAGASLDVTLAWRAEHPVPAPYTVFVHVLNERGELVAQHDGLPVLGTRPTELWQPGEQVLDRHPVALPQALDARELRIVVGMYDSATIVRAPYVGGGDTLTLTTLTLR